MNTTFSHDGNSIDMANEKSLISNLIDTAHTADRLKLVTANSGNLSVRLDDNNFIISGSGSFLGQLNKQDISRCQIDKSDIYTGIKPSMEHQLHREIYTKRNDVNAILHFQSLYATILSCQSNQEFNIRFIPEAVVYINNIEIIPYLLPGSKKLSDEVSSRAENTDIYILKNHGQIVVGYDLNDIIKKASIFEFACKILFLGGNQINNYSQEEIDELIANYGN